MAYFEHVLRPHLTEKEADAFINAKEVGPILKSTACHYKIPVVYPDILTLACKTDLSSITHDHFTQRSICVSHSLEKIVSTADAVAVTYDYRILKKAPIPDHIRKLIVDIETKYGN
ncbi:hypothetical protein SmJEL517_g00211 [Synchytrium microbalum]|uniref:Thioesterase domain-containing protein n=1 Tax=Synchytrium microbalum TaxID=1806994 RepID=A0A507CJ06_9FUNG|nr:uncharacterized protein SmJEL517_g00211 [Synchytrium microbalum]TPX38236.1 hypothetical protein SmJEL517_g00211 [Synchytrium microbalum]